VKATWSNRTWHPEPIGDCASRPIRVGSASPSSRKWRTKSHHFPSVLAWNAQAGPSRAIRNQSAAPSATTKPLASSEVSRVTTETAIPAACGERS
jgi:hypothetical protein